MSSYRPAVKTGNNNINEIPIDAETLKGYSHNDFRKEGTKILANEIEEPNVTSNKLTPTAQGVIPTTGANRFAFLPLDQIIVEQSTDGGLTWQAHERASDNHKILLFSGLDDSSIQIPLKNGVRSCDCMIRISITAMKYNVPEGTPETERFNYWNSNYVIDQERYCDPNFYSIFLSSVMDKIHVEIEYYRGDGQKYPTVSKYDGLSGWSGRNNLRGVGLTFGGVTTQLTNIWNYRFTFRTQAPDGSFDDSKLSTSSTSVMQSILGIQAFSQSCWSYSNPMTKTGNVYEYDVLQRVYFPNHVAPKNNITQNLGDATKRWMTVCSHHGDFSGTLNATAIKENGTPLSSKYALKTELPTNDNNTTIITAYSGENVSIGFKSTANSIQTTIISLNTTLQENDIVRVYFSGTGSYEDMNAGVITFEVAKGANNTKLMGSGSTFTATGGTSGIIFVNVPTDKNQLKCGTYALTDSVYAAASNCYVYKITIERKVQ